MQKIIINLFLILSFLFVLVGCDNSAIPMNVAFKNQTPLGSKNYCITVVFSEDKRIRDKYTDIYIWTSAPTKIVIAKELGVKKYIEIESAEKWLSITNLLAEKLNLSTFARAETTTYILNFEKKVDVKMKVLGGDCTYHLDTGESELVNTFTVSDELKFKIEKTIEFA